MRLELETATVFWQWIAWIVTIMCKGSVKYQHTWIFSLYHGNENCEWFNRNNPANAIQMSRPTIRLQRSSIFPARVWYLFTCFLIANGILDKSPFTTFSRLINSCSSNLSFPGTPDDSTSTFQGDSLLLKNNGLDD